MELKTMFLVFVLYVGISVGSRPRNQLREARPKVYANRDLPYGEKTAVMVTLAKYPTDTIVLLCGTPQYLLLYQEVGASVKSMPRKFLKTNNISQELELHNISPPKRVPYESGWYVVINATFWRLRERNLTLEGNLAGRSGRSLRLLDTTVVQCAPPKECVPKYSVFYCSMHKKPHRVVIGRGTDLVAQIEGNCSVTDDNLNWTIMDYMEKEFASFSTKNKRFSIKPYALRYPIEYKLWHNRYVILITGEHLGLRFGARCYLQMEPGKVEAIIKGGQMKRIKYSSILHMDGSLSRDYSTPFNEFRDQFRTYHWSCTSEDKQNPNCRPKMSTEKKFEIPEDSYVLGMQYKFELHVVSDVNPVMQSSAHQTVKIVDFECLDIAIICQANCALNRYNPGNKMVLKGECYNCEWVTTQFFWFIDNKYVLEKDVLAAQLDTDKDPTIIRLDVRTSDKRKESEFRSLKRRQPPVAGKCAIQPKQGMEASTPFTVSCTNFKTDNKPLEYFYYADRVLLTTCQDNKCHSFLPLHVNNIKVLICDIELTCTSSDVSVRVIPLANITMDTPQSLWKYITTPPNNVIGRAALGRTLRMMAYVQSLAARLEGPKKAELAMTLIRAYDNVHPKALAALGKLANLTHTLAIRLSPISSRDQDVLVQSLRKLNEIFQVIYDDDMAETLVEEPYINVTATCITVLNIMERLNDGLPRPPQALFNKYIHALDNKTLEQPVIDKLLKDIDRYNNEGVKRRSQLWIESLWQTERLYRFLKVARNHGIQADDSGVQPVGVTIKVRCISTDINFTYTIHSNDQMHSVYFSPALIQETKDPDNKTICFKVLSIKRELNWWYPEDKQPSTVLLTVHIYAGEDNFKEERELKHSQIKHKTVLGKYKPAETNKEINFDHHRIMHYTEPKDKRDKDVSQVVKHHHDGHEHDSDDDDEEDDETVAETGKYINCLEHGTLETLHDLRVYRMNLDEQSMLVVRFQHTTHKLRALLIIDNLPKDICGAIKKSGCVVPPDSRNSTILLRNNCLKWHRVYLAVQVDGIAYGNITVPGGPAEFSFVFQVRSCDYWMYSLGGDKQRWSHASCLPDTDYPHKDSMMCTCTVLGTYTSYVFHVPATLVPTDEHVPVRINWVYLIMFFLVVIIIIIWITALFMWHNKPPSKTILCDMTGLEDESQREVHDLLVYLKTGGRMNALTTATVRLIFQTQQRTELHFTLMQDPEHPELVRNSTYVLWLRTRDIRIPTRVAIAHDNAGRYPSWFLRRVELVDLQEQLTQVFVVHRWVRNKFLILSSAFVFHVGDQKCIQHWRQRFTTEFERLWINWGLWQPLTGAWRESALHDSMTRAQRASIFITKIVVVYCVCACYLGPTTPKTVFADRKKVVEIKDLTKMFLISFVFTNLVHFLLELCILKKRT